MSSLALTLGRLKAEECLLDDGMGAYIGLICVRFFNSKASSETAVDKGGLVGREILVLVTGVGLVKHYLVCCMGRSSSTLSISFRHVARTAAYNSSIGMLVNLMGVFHAFPMTNKEWMELSKSMILG